MLWAYIVDTERPHLSLKLCHPAFHMDPNGPGIGLSFPSTHLKERSVTQLRRDEDEEEHSES